MRVPKLCILLSGHKRRFFVIKKRRPCGLECHGLHPGKAATCALGKVHGPPILTLDIVFGPKWSMGPLGLLELRPSRFLSQSNRDVV